MSLSAYEYQYVVSPITLLGGIAQSMPGSVLPILQLLQPELFTGAGGGGSPNLSLSTLDGAFAHFRPMPGGTLADFDIGRYPFANQTTAANAIIFQPLRISLKMICPVTAANTYAQKTAKMQNLQSTLGNHAAAGGTYLVNTPAYPFNSCILLALRDVTGEGSNPQAQVEWQWDFEQPLVTLQQAQAAQLRLGALMQTITNQTQVNYATAPDGSSYVPYSGTGNTGNQYGGGVGLAINPGAAAPASSSQAIPGAGGGYISTQPSS